MTTPLQGAETATDTDGDLFLSGSYIELGLSSYGNLGTTAGATPAGFAQPDPHGVGLVYNEAGFGVDSKIPSIDFFTPGTPYESFAAGYVLDGTQYSGANYKDGRIYGVTETSLTNTSSGSRLSAEWIGVLDGDLKVTIDYSFSAADQYFKTDVTLTNTTSSTMSDVRYDREVDPDNTKDAGGSYSTYNTIVAQQPGSGDSEVTAVSATGDAYYEATGETASLLYYSTDPNSRVADGINFGSTLNPFAATLSTGAGAAGSTTGLSDTAVSINYDGGALAAGASTSFTYYTGMTSDIAAVTSAITETPTVALAAASDSGIVGDDITNIPAPALTGTGVAGDTLTLYDGSTAVGTVSVGSTGAWSITPTIALADGVHGITATQADASGNVSPVSGTLSLTIETSIPATLAAPVLAATSDSGVVGDDITNIAGPAITGTGVAGDTIDLHDGTTSIGVAVVDRTGAWSITPGTALVDGMHSLTATQTDVAGTASTASPVLSLTIDTAVPATPTTPVLAQASDSGTVGDNLTDIATPAITGTGIAGATVTLYDGTAIGTALVDATGLWSITPAAALADGVHNLTATQTDIAGTTSDASAPLSLTIDTSIPTTLAMPVLAVASDSATLGDDITGNTTPTITGTGIAGDTVTLYDGTTAIGTAVTDDSGTWSITPATALAGGLHSLTASQTNAAGTASVSSTTLALTIQTLGTVPTLSEVAGVTASASPILTGSADPGSQVRLYDGAQLLTTVTANSAGTYTYFMPTALNAGTHSLTAMQANAVGDVSLPSTALAVTVNTDDSYAVVSAPDSNGDVVSRQYDGTGQYTQVNTTGGNNELLQSVTTSATLRNIYDNGGTLIGTVSGPGSTTGTPPQMGFDSTPLPLSATTTTDNSGSVITLLSENNTLALTGNDTVNTSGGNATISAAASSVSVTGGAGTLSFFGGSGTSTVAGGAGVTTIAGGSGGGLYAGGKTDGNLLVASGGNTSLVGGIGNDVMFGGAGSTSVFGSTGGSDTILGGSGTNVIVASANDVVFTAGATTVYGAAAGGNTIVGGSGNAIMSGAGGFDAMFGGSGNDALYAGSGTNALVGGVGSTLMVGDAGTTDFIGGSGQSTVYGGAGSDTVWSGTGTMQASLGGGTDTVVLQSGTASVTGGAGTDTYDVIKGEAGGIDVISGFKVGTDQVALYGYNAFATQTVSGGSTILNLIDGTTITLLGVTDLKSTSVV